MPVKVSLVVESYDNAYVLRGLMNNILKEFGRKVTILEKNILKTSGVINRNDVINSKKYTSTCDIQVYCVDRDLDKDRERNLLKLVGNFETEAVPIVFVVEEKIEDLLVIDKQNLKNIFKSVPNIKNSKALVNNLVSGKSKEFRLAHLARIAKGIDLYKLSVKNNSFKKFKTDFLKIVIDMSNLKGRRKKVKLKRMSRRVLQQYKKVKKLHRLMPKDLRLS